jgi:hypothetical protein
MSARTITLCRHFLVLFPQLRVWRLSGRFQEPGGMITAQNPK